MPLDVAHLERERDPPLVGEDLRHVGEVRAIRVRGLRVGDDRLCDGPALLPADCLDVAGAGEDGCVAYAIYQAPDEIAL